MAIVNYGYLAGDQEKNFVDSTLEEVVIRGLYSDQGHYERPIDHVVDMRNVNNILYFSLDHIY